MQRTKVTKNNFHFSVRREGKIQTKIFNFNMAAWRCMRWIIYLNHLARNARAKSDAVGGSGKQLIVNVSKSKHPNGLK